MFENDRTPAALLENEQWLKRHNNCARHTKKNMALVGAAPHGLYVMCV
jgi:hypothetical protein